MLDPEYLAYCADEVEILFSDLETEILKDIARRIRENEYMNTSTAQYQLRRAKALGMQDVEIKKRLANLLKISEKRVANIINTASLESVTSDNMIFKAAYEKGLIADFSFKETVLKETILKGIKATNGEIHNICKTTAITAKRMLANAMDQAYLGIQSGAFSQQEAIKFAIEKISKKGLEWIDYKSGTHRRVDSAIRNAVRTGVNQTACRCQEKNFDEMGGNLVEVSSHMGARPSHALWQGKIYWWKKKHKNYSNFEHATGYGTGAGLGGWNCRHSFYPYFEGLSEKAFEPYRKGENKERYELEQEQRYNERKIREWKRRQAVNKAGGIDSSKEARKVKEWQQRQTDFLKAHPDMKRNYAREKGYNANRILKLGSGSDGSSVKSKVRYVETIDLKDVDKYIKMYENEIKGYSVEHAVIIQGDGRVLHFEGNKKSVRIDEADLNGAIVLHNHPVIEGIETNSFENDDFYFLQNYGLMIDRLRATYGDIRYEVKVLKDISSLNYDSYMYGDIGTALMYGEIEGDVHELIFKQLDKEGYLKYVKSKVK